MPKNSRFDRSWQRLTIQCQSIAGQFHRTSELAATDAAITPPGRAKTKLPEWMDVAASVLNIRFFCVNVPRRSSVYPAEPTNRAV
ncbi:geranylgeranyl pyrophosphate synthase [Aspergillus luchuensis]|uniref:Geranylgeranyl pyrophosphate synthase n=1 Tax=Aspergillus kawachii TaxID=1069201 RepID=A0A146FKU4_ASPKA|nr:geranylgeranyl pyrophosphate synthase [Aspergillus luchuensis]